MRAALRLARAYPRTAGGFGGLAAAVLIQLGPFDWLRSHAGGSSWQLDELLFVALFSLVGLLLAEREVHRRVCEEVARRTEEEREARDLALRDPLTGLFNRRGLEQIAAQPPIMGESRIVFLADLDGFKAINDSCGHATGDELLRRYADRLRGLGPAVQAARLGGDEFVVIATGYADGESLGEEIAATLDGKTRDGGDLTLGVSVGMTSWSGDLALESALEQADLAMYEAKRIGIGLCRFDRLLEEPLMRARQFDRVFERKLATLPNREAVMCVAAISLDRYHNAKRTLGYGFAARLLRAVRARLEEHHPQLLIERLGPETLGVLFPADDAAQALVVMETLNVLSNQSYQLDGLTIDSPLTIGMAGPAPAGALRETVEQAQFALDEARRTGRRQVVFDLREQHRTQQNIKLMAEMQQAIADDTLDLYYQPKLDARTGETDSFEALVRWPHRDRGFVPPNEFVPVAEQSGDIRALTHWVLARAIVDAERMAAYGILRPIYVNISACLVGDEDFAADLLSALNGREDHIGIEITETGVLENPERALVHLRRLAAAGIKIVIDDYGVGLSSLAYLKQLPATELKIDMMFITDLAESHRDPMIVRSTIDLAHGLGLRVTAEGVDKPEALALLKIMGCDLIQGHQIAEAMPMADLLDYMLDTVVPEQPIPDCAALLLAFAGR